MALRQLPDYPTIEWSRPSLTRVVCTPFQHFDPGEDWEIKKANDPDGVYDVAILCEDIEEAYTYLQHEYKARPCVMYESKSMIWRLQCGLFVTVTNKLCSMGGTTFRVWDWIGKFKVDWDLEILRYKQQLREIRKNSLN